MQEQRKSSRWTLINKMTVSLECGEDIFSPRGIIIPKEVLEFWEPPKSDKEVSLDFSGKEYSLKLLVDSNSSQVSLVFDPLLEYEWEKFFDGTYNLEISKLQVESGKGKNKSKSILVGRYSAVFAFNRRRAKTGKNEQTDPSKYDPCLSAETYFNIFSNDQLISPRWLSSLYNFYKMPGKEGTIRQMEVCYGNMPGYYLQSFSRIGKSIVHEAGCDDAPEEHGVPMYWPVLFTRETVIENGIEHYCYRLREPVQNAITMLEANGIFAEEKEPMNQIKLNTILYGPPGTGKTYYSVIYAVAICEGKTVDEIQTEEYDDILTRYKHYADRGRISFTTFHQSYGYEEFIEGIRPVLSEESKGRNSDLKYVLHDGLFKKICKSAKRAKEGIIPYDENTKVWLVWLEDCEKAGCFQNNVIRFRKLEDEKEDNNRRNLIGQIKKGDIVISFVGIDGKGDNFGIVQDDSPTLADRDQHSTFWERSINWNNEVNTFVIESVLGSKAITRRRGIERIIGVSVVEIVDFIERSLKESKVGTFEGYSDDGNKSYVLIIDEINRGNISKILGELITLIEETKRDGAGESMEAILPYSGEKFSVPDNVYIIGTMNTADRSIALMDTALRRRFSFVEMMPDSKVLRDMGAGHVVIDGVNLDVARMLDVINERIEYLYDREHTIGHAFFTRLADHSSIKALAEIFENSIIPLLQEYFYEDYEKIQLILGDNGKANEYKFILDRPINEKGIFNGNTDLDLPEKKYEVQHTAFERMESYKQIGKGI